MEQQPKHVTALYNWGFLKQQAHARRARARARLHTHTHTHTHARTHERARARGRARTHTHSVHAHARGNTLRKPLFTLFAFIFSFPKIGCKFSIASRVRIFSWSCAGPCMRGLCVCACVSVGVCVRASLCGRRIEAAESEEGSDKRRQPFGAKRTLRSSCLRTAPLPNWSNGRTGQKDKLVRSL